MPLQMIISVDLSGIIMSYNSLIITIDYRAINEKDEKIDL